MMQGKFLHIPGRRRAALGAEPAVHADVLVLHHHAARVLERFADIERLRDVLRWRLEPRSQIGLLAVWRHGQAIDRADIDASVALDAELGVEHRLHIAIETALHLGGGLLGGEAELDLDVDVLEALLERDMRHETALDADYIVVEIAKHVLGEHWMRDYVASANDGGIERVLV